MLAADIDISRSYLGDIEAGRKYPSYLLLNKIAEACGTTIEFLNNDDPTICNFEQENISLVAEDGSAYNTNSQNIIFDETLSEDEVIALKSFLEVYRKQKQSQ
jgi:transcriptional regulator with XRE-family HTH domain